MVRMDGTFGVGGPVVRVGGEALVHSPFTGFIRRGCSSRGLLTFGCTLTRGESRIHFIRWRGEVRGGVEKKSRVKLWVGVKLCSAVSANGRPQLCTGYAMNKQSLIRE